MNTLFEETESMLKNIDDKLYREEDISDFAVFFNLLKHILIPYYSFYTQ